MSGTVRGRRPTSIVDRVVMRVRYGARLLRELGAFTVLNGAWWFLPVVVLVILLAIAAGAAQQALPYAVYTLF